LNAVQEERPKHINAKALFGNIFGLLIYTNIPRIILEIKTKAVHISKSITLSYQKKGFIGRFLYR
jgi:hypothetical protein